jgi:uncharacterized protein (UPF0248 family)
MYKRFEDIKTIKFPVYRLPSDDWYTQDGVLFINNGEVLDDRNMPGKTLGIRRIQCGRKDLFRLKRAYTDFPSMLQSRHITFIDSAGVPFIYKKEFNSSLIYHRVLKVEPKDDHSIVWLKDIPYPISIPRPPLTEARWARVLYFKGRPWIIYDFPLNKGKDSFKRV